jgi:hypothetical protein
LNEAEVSLPDTGFGGSRNGSDTAAALLVSLAVLGLVAGVLSLKVRKNVA